MTQLPCHTCGRPITGEPVVATQHLGVERFRFCTTRCRDTYRKRAYRWNAPAGDGVIDPDVPATLAKTACRRCGEPFWPTTPFHRFCSTRCRVAAHRGGS